MNVQRQLAYRQILTEVLADVADDRFDGFGGLRRAATIPSVAQELMVAA